MKTLLVNGSPHAHGCTHNALSEIAKVLQEKKIETEIFHIGTKPVQGCIGCFSCRETNVCIFKDEPYTSLVAKIKASDALVIGAPVYYASIPGNLGSILDRVFFSAGKHFKHKVGAGVVNCRRGGAGTAHDRLNKYFTISQMPLASSFYWNSTHGFNPGDQLQDIEGLQTLRLLADNIAWMLECFAAGKTAGVALPEEVERIRTNFIR